MIKFENVSMRYGPGLEALSKVSFETVSYTHLTLPTIYSV